tara:strand:+ start:2186 stop:2725 length:540 start_codon:yes stop_codon:yes gene_type:complete
MYNTFSFFVIGAKKSLVALKLKKFINIMTHLKVGDIAPVFSGLDSFGEKINQSDFSGRRIALYFYPKDDTPGCTAEACSFRDSYSELLEAGIAIVGVSPDSVKKHAKFTEKYNLPFPLIADEDHTIINSFGVWGPKKFMGREYEGVYRETFIIGLDGRIEEIIEKVKTKESAEQILASV